MESKKINQLATNVSPQTSDLTIIGDPTTGVSKKITLLQIANLFATTGTVTSVGVTETGDALTITGSPITTAGTINIGFAGAATQYVRGDGALADFPTSTGGGSSVSYYLNSSVSQGTIGGVAYRQLSKTPIAGAGTDITISANGYVASYITDSNDPALLEVPAGNFNCEFYFSVNSNAHNPNVYAELYKYDGTTFTLLGSSQSIPEYLKNGSTLSAYYFAMPIAVASLTITDRLAIRIYVNVDTRIVTLHTENSHLCQVVTTFSKGLTTLNSLTRQTQYFATGTSGTDFAISSSLATHTFNLPDASATNRGLITTGTQTIAGDKSFTGINSFDYGINYKTGASLANVSGYISQAYATSGTGAGSTLSLKISDGNSVKAINLDFVGSPATYTYTFPAATGTIALTSDLTSGTVTSVAALTLGTTGTDLSSTVANGTTTPVITLNVPTASATNRGALSSADWTTFNNKQAALTNPVTGTGTTNYLSKFTGASTIGNSNITDTGSLITLGSNTTISSGALGIAETTLTGYSLRISKNITGLTSAYGVRQSGTVQSDVTADAIGYRNDLNIAAASFTLTNYWHFWARQGTIGAGSTVTNQYGYFVDSTFTGATNNYGFYGNIASGTNRWNLYMNGTANNYMAGSLGIGTNNPSDKLNVVVSANGNNTRIDGPSSGIIFQTNATSTDIISYGGTTPSYRQMNFATGANTAMSITSGGDVVIGIATAATNVQLNINGYVNKAGRIQFQESGVSKWLVGNGAASENGRFEIYDNTNGTGVQLLRGDTSWTALSDERFKDIIEPISVNDKLKNVRAIIGKYKTDKEGVRRNFLIAQDLLKVFPEVVNVDEDETKPMGVRYQDLIPVLVKAIQEMNTKLDAQNQTIQNLQEQINILAK